MSLVLRQTATAIGPGLSASFSGSGGVEPYAYSVLPGGVGGSIDEDGIYTAPAGLTGADTILVVDSADASAQATIAVCNPLELFCDVIRRELELGTDQVYLWDQKINIPKDSRLYVAIGVSSAKPFGSTMRFSPGAGLDAEQAVNMIAKLDVNILSRGPDARDRKEEVVLALGSVYAQQQQAANSFYIAPLSENFVNLSQEDGAAIPYRFTIPVTIQYVFRKTKSVPYFDDFDTVDVTTES